MIQDRGAGPRVRKRILVVDDDEDVRDAIALVLRDEDYEIECAANGRSALDALRRPGARFALVLLDLVMPGMDGARFLAVRAGDSSIAQVPVLVLSASGGAGTRPPGGRAGRDREADQDRGPPRGDPRLRSLRASAPREPRAGAQRGNASPRMTHRKPARGSVGAA